MDLLQHRIAALIRLGDWIADFLEKYPNAESQFVSVINNQKLYNPWLVELFVLKALAFWRERLKPESLLSLVQAYPLLTHDRSTKHVAVIAQDNIPLAGFHDFMMVLIAGHHFYGRNENHSNDLLQYLTTQLSTIDQTFTEFIHWDASFKKANTFLLHTKAGSDDALQRYFASKHSLVSQNRVSVAVITSNDSTSVFEKLGDDIFTFFGLSSYSVRKLFVPKTFSFTTFFEAIEKYSWLYQYNRYANNYDYHKSVFLMDLIPIYDNGFVVLRESSELHVPPGCLYYEFYDTLDDLFQRIDNKKLDIQQVVTSLPDITNGIKPGMAHSFSLFDYEDHKDTMQFLLT